MIAPIYCHSCTYKNKQGLQARNLTALVCINSSMAPILDLPFKRLIKRSLLDTRGIAWHYSVRLIAPHGVLVFHGHCRETKRHVDLAVIFRRPVGGIVVAI